MKITNRTKKKIGYLIALISFIIFLIFNSWFFHNWWIFIVLFFFISYFLEDSIIEILEFGGIFGIIIFLFYIVGIWQKESIFMGFTINNEFMIVVLTTIYVLFTYINFKTAKKHSEISRLPYLKLDMDDWLELCLINTSDKLAKDIEMSFKFLKPKEKLINRFKEAWNYYDKKITLNSLEARKTSSIPMQKIFEEILPVKRIYKPGAYKLKRGEKEFKVNLVIECTYSSDTYFKTESPVREEVLLHFKKNKVEIIKQEKDYGDWKDIT